MSTYIWIVSRYSSLCFWQYSLACSLLILSSLQTKIYICSSNVSTETLQAGTQPVCIVLLWSSKLHWTRDLVVGSLKGRLQKSSVGVKFALAFEAGTLWPGSLFTSWQYLICSGHGWGQCCCLLLWLGKFFPEGGDSYIVGDGTNTFL